MLIRLKLFNVLVLLFASVCAYAQSGLPNNFRIGIVPNVSANVLMTNYAPLKNYFIQQGLTQSSLNTAENFIAFNQLTRDNAFDLLITAPHMGRLAQVDYKYTALSTLSPSIRALLISSTQNTTSVDDLKDSTIAFANPQSFVAMIGTRWMESRGHELNKTYKSVTVPREDNIGRLVGEGEVKFGILSNAELRAVPERFQAKLRVVQVISETPNFIFLTNPNFSTQQVESVRQMLQKFSENNEHSDQFFKLTGFTTLRPVTEAQLKPLDAYLAQTRTALAPQPALAFVAAPTSTAPPSSMRFATETAMNLNVQFFFNSSQIRPESQATLAGLVQILNSSSAAASNYVIEGHTDANGSAASNLRLSAQRAEAVVAYLVSKGVSPARLTAVGKGATQPLIPASPKAKENRRVVVVKAT